MQKILLFFLLGFTLLFSAQTATVTGLDPNGDGFLSLRTKPKGREIGKLYNGDKVKILKKKGKYYKVKVVKSGIVGYAHSNWIRKIHTSKTSSSSSTSSSHKKGKVYGLDPNGDGFLSLRNKPKGREIGKLYNGDSVDILATRGKWYKVKLADSGQMGWAHGNWVREISSITTSTSKKREAFSSEQLKRAQETCYSGNSKMCFALGEAYHRGVQVKQNDNKAAKFYLEACNTGRANGCFNAGILYEIGKGIKKDEFKASKMYIKGCNKNHSASCYNLGVLYMDGRGVSQDISEAMILFDKSCGKGEMQACCTLGVIYIQGYLIKKDINKAEELFKKSCDGGYAQACKLL